MAKRASLLGVVCCLVLLAGCQRLNFESTYKVGPGEVKPLEFDPPRYAQKLSVTVTPTAAPVSAYVVKKGDVDAVEKALYAQKEPSASLLLGSRVSSGTEAETYSFDASVPPGTEYSLLLSNQSRKPTDVKVQVKGR